MADVKTIETKLARGEALTAEENKFVMGVPLEADNNENIPPDLDFSKEEAEDISPKKEEKKDDTVQKTKEETKTKETNERQFVLEEELSKPDGQEDLTNLTPREKALFWDMRRERKNRQRAEEERDALKFNELKRKAEIEAEAVKKTEKGTDEGSEEEDIFRDRDPEDIPTIADLKKFTKNLNKKSPTPKKEEEKTESKNIGSTPLIDMENPLILEGLRAQEKQARAELDDDVDEVLECTQEIIGKNPEYLRQIADGLRTQGTNVPKLMYALIKGDPDFNKVLPLAQARLKSRGYKKPEKAAPKSDALEAQRKMEENQNKPKTSIHATGQGEAEGKNYGGYTFDYLWNLSDISFSKIPKKVREEFLRDIESKER